MKRFFYLILCFTLLSTCLFAETYSLFVKDGKYGLINQDRRIVIESKYDYISIMSSGIIICSEDSTHDIYNESLKLVYSGPMYVSSFLSKTEIVLKHWSGEKKVLDISTGNLNEYKKNPLYIEEYGYRDDCELVFESNAEYSGISIIDRKGNVLLRNIKDANQSYSEGMIAVILKDGRSGFVNKKGKLVIETTFYIDPDDIAPRWYPMISYAFNENYALVKNKDKKWIQFDKKGRSKELPISIEPVDPYYENGLVLIRDKRTKKFGYMNPKFEIVIPCQFDGARRFVGKYAVVVFRDKEAIIDKEGNVYLSKDLKSMSYNFF